MAASNLHIFTWVYSNFDSVFTNYIANTSQSIVSAITPVAYTMFAIYILLWGFSMIRGLIDEPVTDALFRLLKIALVLGFALNAGRYQTDVVQFFMKTPDAMASVLAFGQPAQGDTSTFANLDTLINKTVDVARNAWNDAGIFNGNMGMYLAAFVIMSSGIAFAVVAGLMVVVGKFAMVLLLASGPMFILMVMFKTTQRFFDSWLGQVINYMLLLILTLAVVTMFLQMMDIIVQDAGQKVLSKATLEAMASIMTVSIACIVLLFQVAPIASALAGGVALATTSAARRVVGDGLSMATKGASMGKLAAMGAGKATLGASVAAKAVGQLFRGGNSIRRG